MFAVTSHTIAAAGVARAAADARGVRGARAPRASSARGVGGARIGGRVAMGASKASRRSVRTAATEDEAMDAGFEAPAATGQVFPRVKERDPYRRLGISSEATYEEVQDARNYLVDAYRSHTAGVEAIEQAFDRIIQEKLTSRKKAKGMKQALRKKKQGEDYVPPFLERLQAQFARPDDQTIIRRAVVYAIMAGWAIVQSAQSGPAFQMAIAFGLTVYFLNDKRGGDKAMLGKAFVNAFVALVIGWLVGSVFPVYIPIFPETWSPELILSLFSFVSFFVFATFLK